MKRGLMIGMAALMLAGPIAGGVAAGDMASVSAASKSGLISESRAKTVAMRDAKITASKVKAMDVDLDETGTNKKYTVEFCRKQSSNRYMHYVYKINARTGVITKKNSASRKLITKKKARNEALDDADLDRDEVRDIDVSLDEGDGVMVYEVSFTEKDEDEDYEATVNAFTGSVIDSDSDDDDD